MVGSFGCQEESITPQTEDSEKGMFVDRKKRPDNNAHEKIGTKFFFSQKSSYRSVTTLLAWGFLRAADKGTEQSGLW